MSPRPYRIGERKAAGDKTRERILAAARQVLLAEDFSEFTMDAVARAADVARLTVYYQFDSKPKLLEALYDYIAQRGGMEQLARVFQRGNDALQHLDEFIGVFVRFWASDRDVIRRLHGLGVLDSEIGQGLRARNERRRRGIRVIVDRYTHQYRMLNPIEEPEAIDMLHVLTSFETFDGLANGRDLEAVSNLMRRQAHNALKYIGRGAMPKKV